MKNQIVCRCGVWGAALPWKIRDGELVSPSTDEKAVASGGVRYSNTPELLFTMSCIPRNTLIQLFTSGC